MRKGSLFPPATGWNRWLEPIGALAVLGALANAFWFLHRFHYLPQPFFFDPMDTYMDWVNTSLWARDKGTYDTWLTIYPPLSFVFMRIFGIDACYASEAKFARECDWLGIGTLHAFYVLDIILIAMSYLKIDRSTAVWRSVALGAGLPLLFALDRGQLLLVCFSCFILAYGPLLKSARLRWLAAGLAINFKPYLIASIFPQLLRRRWLWFEGAILAVLVVYLVTYGILGIGTPKEIVDNLINFAGDYQAISFLDLWYAATYKPVLSLLNGPIFPIVLIVGSGRIESWGVILPVAQVVVQLTILLACAAAWLRPEKVPMYRLTNFGVSFALITAESGGYTQMLMIYLVFMERWKGVGRKYAILACYILCVPAEIVLNPLNPLPKDSYLGGRLAYIQYGVALGPFLRPGIILSLPFALACVTIRDVWQDVRAQGWRQRLRFRRDFPLLLQGGRTPDPVPAE